MLKRTWFLTWLLLHEEEHRRLSESVQKRMADAETSGWQTWLTVAEQVQHETCAALNVPLAMGLRYLRIVDPNDPILSKISFYRRHNRISFCTLHINDVIPPIELHSVSVDGKIQKEYYPTSISDQKLGHIQVVELLITGSVT
jgi:hypothetical protein